MITVGIITASDKGFARERKDESGPLIADMLHQFNGRLAAYIVVPDEREIISSELKRMSDELEVDLILTTGGTGLSPRDITPEATLDVIDRLVPGIAEGIRHNSLSITPRAMLSRGIAGIRNQTLIINLPGSPKAVQECMDFLHPILSHAIEILKGQTRECAQKPH